MENEILLFLKENVAGLSLGQILPLLGMRMRFVLICSNEDASKGRSKFDMRELGLEEGTCSINLRVVCH